MTSPTPPATNNPKHESQLLSASKKSLPIQRGDISNLSFWVGQIFMLLATVLGVYLAGQQGLQQALVFDRLQSDKNNYYLRKSLQDELTDNLVQVKEYTNSIQGVSVLAARRFNLDLDLFIWESMKFSSATLETPSALLSESRQFYRKVNDIYQKVQSGYHDPAYGVKLLEEIIDHMENKVMPLFDADIKTLKDTLEKQEVSV